MLTTRISRDLRIRQKCFPNAGSQVFEPKKHKAFIPLPIVMRKLLKYLAGNELRVLIYLQLRAGKEFICYPHYDEIAREANISKGAISKAVKALEKNGFIQTYNDNGIRRYFIPDPQFAIERLCEHGIMSRDDLDDVNDLREKFNHPPIQYRTKQVTPITAKRVGAAP